MSGQFPWRVTEMLPVAPGVDSEAFVSDRHWAVERPQVLVVCCSDGRLQEIMDEFLQERLGVRHYDRFYAPGGPGALATSGYEFLRASHYREDTAFLLRARRSRPHPDFPWSRGRWA